MVDFDRELIERAKESVKKEKINNVKFEVSSSSEFQAVVTFFDSLHDMGEAEGVVHHRYSTRPGVLTGNQIAKSLPPPMTGFMAAVIISKTSI